jgi:hypothetical protein
MTMDEIALTFQQAAAIATPLRQLLEQLSRTNSAPLPPDLVQLLNRFDACRRAVDAAGVYRNPSTVSELRPVQSVNVKQAARVLGCSEQNVRARCKRGSLDAHLDGGRWKIYL